MLRARMLRYWRLTPYPTIALVITLVMAVAILLVVLVIKVTGGGPVDVSAAEQAVRGADSKITIVDCPAGVSRQPGSSFECQISDAQGDSGLATVHQVSSSQLAVSSIDISWNTVNGAPLANN
jgi:hypothetical protein